MLANGLNAAMLSEFSTREKMKESLGNDKDQIKEAYALSFPCHNGYDADCTLDLSDNVQPRILRKVQAFFLCMRC